MSDRIAVFKPGPDRADRHARPRSTSGRRTSSSPRFVGVSNVLERGRARFTIRPEKIRLLGASGPGDTRAGRSARWSTSAAVTRYVVELDGRAASSTSSARTRPALRRGERRQRGRPSPGARSTHSQSSPQEGGGMRRVKLALRRAWRCVAVALGSAGGRHDEGAAANEGKLNDDRVGGLPRPEVGEAVREADRLQGAGQVRRLVGRDGDADALRRRRPVRHGLRVRRREPAPDLRRRRRSR